MFSGFSAQKLKPQLKMATSRFQITSNKKAALVKQQMRDVAVMLNEDPPKEEKAKIRAEAIIREEHAIEAYEILMLECELLSERIKLIQVSKECPPDLLSCISTVMWACDRVDIPELVLIRKQFRAKYGKEFEERALNNVGGVLNERVVSRLSVQPPAAYLVQTYLERICEKFEVSWKPKVPVEASEMAEPMAAPVGYSVQVASASGLNVTTGQAHTDTEAGYNGPPKDNDDDNNTGGGDGGFSIPSAPVVATPYVPTSVAAPMAPVESKQEDFEEVDIFIPAIPASSKKDDGSSDAGTNGGSSGVADDGSYANLAARFDKLNK
jgi:vacuolar protein sorting-associated protein IST1